jgi:hypothetical protein
MPANEELYPPHGLVALSATHAASVLAFALRKDSFHRYVMLSEYGLRAEGIIDVGTSREFFTDLLVGLQEEGNTFLWALPHSRWACVW